MKWVTRERPKIDRIACPWLIARFIDDQPEFLYVPSDQVRKVAGETGAIPYDVPDVELSHVGELCSFDAFLNRYGLDEPELQELATIVRGADTGRFDLAPQASGLLAFCSACRRCSRTTTRCCATAWSCTTPSMPGSSGRATRPTAGRPRLERPLGRRHGIDLIAKGISFDSPTLFERSMRYPRLNLLAGQDRRLRAGHPWVFSNELQMDAAAKALPQGEIVCLFTADGRPLALAQFNPHSLIAARVLSRDKDAVIDARFVERRVARALRLREKLYEQPYYRLVHAEADGLPGLVVDRFGDVLVCQLNSAGMARLEEPLLDALQRALAPRAVVLRNDSPVRELEGLALETRVARGALEGQIELVENDLTYLANPLEGQKTGWYYDQRDNRAFAARLARGGRVLDLYSYSGGFAVAAAAAGAREALAIDRSQAGLDLAMASAERNGLAGKLATERQDAFAALDALAADKQRFDLVIADPPAFVKSKRDLKPGLRGYRKLARACGVLVAEAGFLMIACCSHNVPAEAFADEVRRGLRDAGRGARLVRQAGTGPDHPGHPALPESGYLKCLFCALD